MTNTAYIQPTQALTLAALFRERISRTPEAVAYINYLESEKHWQQHSWRETAQEVSRWQQAFQNDGLVAGDRVAIMCRNTWEWVICDQAALGLGLVIVPVYTNDRPENIGWILEDSGASAIFIDANQQWQILEQIKDQLVHLKRIVSLEKIPTDFAILSHLDAWLQPYAGQELQRVDAEPNSLATIVYTSGTTGRPKGVMLSHHNILFNVHAALSCFAIHPEDKLLSFLPMSHTFERTVGYYLAVAAGCSTTYNRSVPQLAEDLVSQSPTILISVPRIFERIHTKISSKLESESPIKRNLFHFAVKVGALKFEHDQGRAHWSPLLLLHPLLDRLVGHKVREKLGGQLRFTVCGGAALSPHVANFFIGLGIPVVQGYGLTETSPIIAANRLDDNLPSTVGLPFPGIEVTIGMDDELMTRSDSVMLGYWNNQEATDAIIDDLGWLHTGDKASIDSQGHIWITGRIKEIIVLSNGEKVPPSDIENAILLDGLFDQVMLIGEAKSYLSVLVVLNPEKFKLYQAEHPGDLDSKEMNAALLKRVKLHLSAFPGYAKVRRLAAVDPWTTENGLLTPTLKMRRNKITERYQDVIDQLYAGHG